MLRTPPHILVTTPESLYLLLTSDRSRQMLRTVAHGDRRRDPRGHRLAPRRAPRADPRAAGGRRRAAAPAHRPVGDADADRGGGPIPDRRRRAPAAPSWTSATGVSMDLGVEMPGSPLDAVMSHEVWEEDYDRLTALVTGHRTTLIFVNTRRMAERLARHLSDRLGEDAVTAHHGSLSKEKRLDAETRLKSGRLQGAGRHRLARARHRHRPRRPGVPDRLAAPDRHAAAARRPLGPHDRRHAEGPRVPGVARRPGGMRGAAALDPLRPARRHRVARRAARRAGAADRRRVRVPRLCGRRPLRAGDARLAVSRARSARRSTACCR